MSTSEKKFLLDICRAVGCDNESICQRCGNINESNFKKLMVDVLDSHNLDEEFDDLDQIEMILACEEKYNVEIPDKTLMELPTPRHCLMYLRKRLCHGRTR